MPELDDLDARMKQIERALSMPYFKRNSEMQAEIEQLRKDNTARLEAIVQLTATEKELRTHNEVLGTTNTTLTSELAAARAERDIAKDELELVSFKAETIGNRLRAYKQETVATLQGVLDRLSKDDTAYETVSFHLATLRSEIE